MENLKALEKKYLDYCRDQKELNFKTLKAYGIDLQQFLSIIPTDSLPVSKEMLSDYLTHIHKQYKPKSVKRKIASIKAFFIIWNMKRLLQKIPLTSFVFSSGSRFVFQRPFLYISQKLFSPPCTGKKWLLPLITSTILLCGILP